MNECTERVLVLGNGPSLKEEHFNSFRVIPCLGMNAAYRYWDRIGWYPDYYCCLDDQVVVSHAASIRRLIEEHRCKFFFLHDNFFREYPDLAGTKNVITLCQIRPGANNARLCKELGLDHRPSDLFHSTQPGKLTTGAYAVRFTAWLGFRSVGLIGIDCRYKEILPETKVVDGIVLELDSTPKENPNYFFSDYQVAGDRYNVPNPDVHDGNLHLQSFEALRDDIEHYGFPLDIHICSRESELYDQAVFPFLPIGDFIRGAFLSAVMVPFTKRDIPLLLQRFESWSSESFAPYDSLPNPPRVRLCLCFNGAPDQSLEASFRSAFTSGRLNRFFRSLTFFYSNLEGLRDLYTREYDGEHGPEGYMAGPNNQFFDITGRFSEGMGHIMLMEADVVPLRSGWLERIEAISNHPDSFWISGSHYRGKSRIESFWHVNGNAIYNVGDHAFRQFMAQTFKPYFLETVKRSPAIPYDIVLYLFFRDLFEKRATETRFRSWQSIAHRVRFSDFIVNLSSDEDRQPTALLSRREALDAFPNSVLFHGATERMDREVHQKTCIEAGQGRLVYIDCDAVDNWGHYLAYSRQLKETAGQMGLNVSILTNRKLAPDIHPALTGHLIPTFTDHSWARDPASTQRFSEELGAALAATAESNAGEYFFIYMYTAGLWHAEAIEKMIDGHDNISANVNLFHDYATDENDPEVKRRWKPFLERCIRHPNLVVTVPTETMANDFAKAFGVRLPVAPHPTTTFDDEESVSMIAGDSHTRGDQPSVLFPGGVRPEKGFALSLSASTTLSRDYGIACHLRAVVRADTPQELTAGIENAREAGVTVSSGVLDESSFKALLTSGDVLVCPYLPSAFARRTSGMIIDALLLGRPVVAIKGTWLGDVAETTGAGLACAPDSDSIVSAVRKVIRGFDEFSTAAARARRNYFLSNSWQALVSSVLEGDSARPESEPHMTGEADAITEAEAVNESKPSDFRRANELLRHRDYQQALRIYVTLLAQHHLDIYEFNASLATKRLGYGSIPEAMIALEKRR